MALRQRIIVKAGSCRYPVIFSRHRRQLGKIIGSADRVIIISNPTVFSLHGDKFVYNYLPDDLEVVLLLMEDGERFKTQKTVNNLYDQLFSIHLGRCDTIIAFGGGVVGDTAGFTAATYMRGVGLIQAPTTLLSMVDSSIGGKVGINHARGKNLIGAFYQPRAVVVDPVWLTTLGRREMVEGLAEIIKVGFLSSAKFLHEAVDTEPVFSAGQKKRVNYLIQEAMKFKADVVGQDANDRDVRAILNFGHTFAHAIEKAEGFRKYRHGEAVLAGMVGAFYLSYASGHLTKSRMKKYQSYLNQFVKDLAPLKRKASDYLSPMYVDKKGSNGRLQFVLLEKIGCAVLRTVRSEKKVLEAIEFMKEFVNNKGVL
jgi:3-dehydroquinate synthase